MEGNAVILVISSLGIAQALFLCFYLFTLRKGNRRANIFLALLLLGLTIRIGKSILNVYLDLSPWQRNLGISGMLLAGPCLWFYGKALLQKPKTFNTITYIHLLPFLLFAILCAFVPNDGSYWAYVFYLGVFFHLSIYILLSVHVLSKTRGKAHRRISKWYRNLIFGTSLIWLFYIGNITGIIPLYIGGAIFFSFLVYTFSFLLLQRHDFSLEKYSTSNIDVATSKKLFIALKQLFKVEELYLDSTISLSKVAERIECSPRDVSRAINENQGKNFSEFVNAYRIQKAKALLADTAYLKEKIATIAYDCGFGNVTSFNLAFKAETQLTPSQYRNQFKPV
ncbi:AraC family transcriptional regulator [Flavobacteriaceae bacterium MAR_2009_75]|nr:AraC family transcriptional regulator [Flavobacteriaceae bacterium MAR_2009_75]